MCNFTSSCLRVKTAKNPKCIWFKKINLYREVYSFLPKGKLFLSVQFSCSVVSNSLQPYGLQHARPPCPSPTPRACSNSCPSSWWCHPTISSSAIPFSSCLQSFPASGSFPKHCMETSILLKHLTYFMMPSSLQPADNTRKYFVWQFEHQYSL